MIHGKSKVLTVIMKVIIITIVGEIIIIVLEIVVIWVKIRNKEKKIIIKIIHFLKNIIYLLEIQKNIFQKINKNYCQSLSHSVAESISELIISFNGTSYEEKEDAPITIPFPYKDV